MCNAAVHIRRGRDYAADLDPLYSDASATAVDIQRTAVLSRVRARRFATSGTAPPAALTRLPRCASRAIVDGGQECVSHGVVIACVLAYTPAT